MNILNNLKISIRKLFQKGQNNLIKILSLGIGLAIGSVLIAKVYFEQHYDTFFPDAKNLYLVKETIDRTDGFKEYPSTPGAVAPGLKKYVSQIEASTRFTTISDDKVVIETEDKKKYESNCIALADSSIFDVIPRNVIAGNAKETLSRMDYCMMPKSLADAIGGDVIGKKVFFPSLSNSSATVGAIYEDYPENSQFHYLGIIISLSSINSYIWDGRNNWEGNDRYTTIFKLNDNATTEDIIPGVERMLKENLPLKDLEKNGVKLGYNFIRLSDNYTDSESVKRMSLILSFIAFVLLFSTIMNYILIVIAQMIKRSKEMAVHKCYGAERSDIYSMISIESLISFVLALMVSALIFILFKSQIEDILNTSLYSLFMSKGNWLLLAISVLILFIIIILSGWMYSRIPVAVAFRGYNANKRKWKLSLLSIQIASVGFLFSLLILVWRQYDSMINDNPGYKYENLAIVNIDGVKNSDRNNLAHELKRLSCVEDVTSAYSLLMMHQSGDNITLPGNDEQLFNACDLYYVGSNYCSALAIPIIQGRSFTENADSTLAEVIVDRKFVDKMKLTAGWSDNIIGRQIHITDHEYPNYTICGVIENIRIGSIAEPDLRPAVLFPMNINTFNLLVKFHHLDEDGMTQINKLVTKLYPDKIIKIRTYKSEMINLYQDSRRFRNAVMTGGLVTIVIALIALVGYINDEVLRRSKEIAIRKVNGAEAKDIISIFIKDIMKIAVPSLVVGGIGAYYIALRWQEQFSEKVLLSPLIFIGCGLLILAVILNTVIINSYKIANSNPVEYIKGE